MEVIYFGTKCSKTGKGIWFLILKFYLWFNSHISRLLRNSHETTVHISNCNPPTHSPLLMDAHQILNSKKPPLLPSSVFIKPTAGLVAVDRRNATGDLKLVKGTYRIFGLSSPVLC